MDVSVRGKNLLKKMDLIIGTAVILLLSLFPRRKRKELSGPPKTILVLKLAALGDTLLLIPALRALRAAFPFSRVIFIGTSINEELASLFPQYIDEFKRFEVDRSLRDLRYFVRFTEEIRNNIPDIVFDFEQWSFITPIIVAFSRGRASVGFKTPGRLRHLLFDNAFERLPNTHESQNFLRLLNVLKIANPSDELELPVGEDEVQRARNSLLRSGWTYGQKLIVVHPGCGAHGFPREWPLDSYRDLCAQLTREQNVFIVFTGNGVEERLTRSLASSFRENSVGWTDSNLVTLIATFSISDLIISGNNGIMHIAAALRRPQIALHGPTDSVVWGPINSRAVVVKSSCPGCPCLDLGFEYHRTDGFCMSQIPVEDVLKNSIELLNQTGNVEG
jgi:lipopolysaccharide heptosyltransferase III